jgi:hypothetical protein
MTTGKKFWLSKTFWVNLLAIIALILQGYTDWIISPEAQASALAAVNVVLRLITKEAITWSDGDAAA